MTTGGIFVTLSDEETLNLYLERGVYGQHMTPQEGEPSPHSAHYRTLADYGAVRDGYHVFFFLDRTVYYGGQIVGPDDHGAFYLNGRTSPMGREADAPLVWDESGRDRYDATDRPGVFERDEEDDGTCQPFLIRFEDELGLAGEYVGADRYYVALGKYPYLLPSNSVETDFCTLTPGETARLLDLLRNDSDGRLDPTSDETVELEADPVPYVPEYGIDGVDEARSKRHLEAAVVSNPTLLAPRVRPAGRVVCRRVPVSPFKPTNVDRADVCYYSERDSIEDGTLPNAILDVRTDDVGDCAALRVRRYLLWLYRRLGNDAARIDVFIYAADSSPAFWNEMPDEYESQVEVITFADR